MNGFDVKSVSEVSGVRPAQDSLPDELPEVSLYEDTLQSRQAEDLIEIISKMEREASEQARRERRHFVISLLVSLIAASAAVVSVILEII